MGFYSSGAPETHIRKCKKFWRSQKGPKTIFDVKYDISGYNRFLICPVCTDPEESVYASLMK